MRTPRIETCQFVTLTDLSCYFKQDQFSQFCDELSCGSISWGDADRTFISAERFVQELDEIIDACAAELEIKHIRELVAYLKMLQDRQVYIDLEN